MKKRIKILFFSLLLVISVFAIGNFVLAQSDLAGLSDVGQEIALSDTDPRIVVARVIQIALGFLGIITVGLIIYGGWMYMTSEGNEERVEKAKNILKVAVIGLIIILSAFGIASFIISRLLGATGISVEGCVDGDSRACGCGGAQVCSSGSWGACISSSCGSQGGIDFYVRSTTPNDEDVHIIRNIKISAFLNKSLADSISQNILNDNVTVEKIGDVDEATGEITPANEIITGTVSTSLDNSVIDFLADSECEVLGQVINNCLPAWSQFKVSINTNTDLIDMNDTRLNDGEVYEFVFSTNNEVDLGPPTAGIVPAQICQDDGTIKIDSNIIGGWARDDQGLNYLAFYQKKSDLEFYDLKYFELANGDEYYFTKHKYDTTEMSVGDSYDFKVEAEDIAGDYGEAVFTADIKPGHCCNGIKDADEEEIDCGGADCLSCAGGPCNIAEPNQCGQDESNCSDSLCSTFFCECKPEDECICEKKPIIDWVSPGGGFCNEDLSQPCNTDNDCTSGTCNSGTPNANHGNIITIGGRNFGNTSGKVYFGDIEAGDPSSENADCDSNWTDTEITVLVPDGIESSPIKVVSANGYEDATDDNYGGFIPDFEITGFNRPGLCKINPNSGEQDDRINYYGLGLLNSSVFFGDNSYNFQGLNEDFTVATGLSGSTQVPNIEDGKTSTFVKIKIENVDVESNYKDFTKTPSTKGPQIFSFDPTEGNTGQYVTIRGRGFGDSQGASEVYFGDQEASYEFPEICSDSLWSDGQVIVKVPEGINDGNYLIKMNIEGLGYEINTSLLEPSSFNVSSSLDLKPGVCKIEPYFGLPGSEVSLWGEYFGTKDTNSKVRFSNNKDQSGNSITFWDIESAESGVNPYKVDTTVHSEAITGPVKIVKGSPEVAGNGIDFEVGYCYDLSESDQRDVCGLTEDGRQRVCCSEDSFRAGECQNDIRDCYFEVKNSVYEFEFKTGVNCPDGSEACGTSCCSVLAGGCEDSSLSKCATCSPGLNLCDDNNCCTVDCELDLVTGNTICPTEPESCSGYGYNQCVETDQCPNSPGICSPYGTADDGGCECCCEIGQDGDCCLGLTCTGTCGSDTTDDNSGYGLCTGCTVTNENGEIDQYASDEACNCTGYTGKFCDTNGADGRGVCRDCNQLSTLPVSKCVEHSATCCFDAKSDTCKGGNGRLITSDENEDGYGYCPYYACDANNNCIVKKDGNYSNSNCDSQCGANPGGASCYDSNTTACTKTCLSPYNCMGETGCQGASGDSACSANDETCICCCDPGDANACQAAGLEGLNCQADKIPCSGDNRGLCCGCFTDSECVSTGEATNVGCSSDSCCRPRPAVSSTYPIDGNNQVCRNTEIGAWFDTLMDVTSFADNILVLGDYESATCPKGTQYLVLENSNNKSIFVRVYLKIKRAVQRTIARVVSPVLGETAYAYIAPNATHAYCAVPGVISGKHNANATQTKIVFKPKVLLDPDTKYYAIIKGDENLDSKQGVESFWKVAMAGDSDEEFNGIEFKNAYIWEFTTLPDQGGINNGVCQVEKVEIDPVSYLFQTTENDLNENDTDRDTNSFDTINDSDKLFIAQAVNKEGQPIIPISNYYDWNWSWYIDNNSVVDFIESVSNLKENEKLVKAQTGITDNVAILTARINVSGSYFDELQTINPNLSNTIEGQAKVWVFICDNPWPAPGTNGWSPWKDDDSNCLDNTGDCYNTNYELYYCRDAGEFGTADDLPVIQDGTVTRGKSDNVLKESYFFREGLPGLPDAGASFLDGSVDSSGKKINLHWSQIIDAQKYKIYYGRNSKAYTIEIEVNALNPAGNPVTNYVVDNLENGVDYYFAVTAVYANGAESAYSNEVRLKPWDSQGPSAPQDIEAIPGDGKVDISWKDNSNGDADKFTIQYKCDVSSEECNSDLIFATQPQETDTKTSHTVSGLTNGLNCCFGLIAYDEYGNKSVTSTILATPAQ